MLFNSISIYSISFIGIILIIIVLSLSNTRTMFTNQLHTKRKKRYSINNDTNNLKNLYMTIQMNRLSNIDSIKYIRSGITTIPLHDDEELMKSEISLKFYENDAIELRLEQDFDSDNEMNDENDN
ncbi:unnamed protein product [Rotaria sp. Silwood1]|nr:unnamed protein product [Rotaria sp. Silwood1]CAF1302200.1 unnamed protein product [Rotaria sp. Silwood1]CAF1303907.1 unnamed protein product [Rotaria sp. Silwood1]CAF3494307.1 unnamed protein product [Rotaria sp. Silwood1]CAF3549479.1 unnamed protein product [Rotaria sp. Silwood1]